MAQWATTTIITFSRTPEGTKEVGTIKVRTAMMIQQLEALAKITTRWASAAASRRIIRSMALNRTGTEMKMTACSSNLVSLMGRVVSRHIKQATICLLTKEGSSSKSTNSSRT